ncbi:MAG: TolC family protein, partial [Leptospiraceae bacterium]|nr:TolC family protein [Leptospiraceae bacterium]
MSDKQCRDNPIEIDPHERKSDNSKSRRSNFSLLNVYLPVLWAYSLLFLPPGCISVGPDYEAPETKATEQWNAALSPDIRVSDNPESMANWWSDLNDPVLTDILKTVVEQNPNLQLARARVREARARRGLAGTERFPTINLKGDATGRATTISSQPDSLTDAYSTDVTTAILTEQLSDDEPDISKQTLYTAGVDASWELDIFGGIRRSIEAADADLEASRADYRDTLVSLLAEASLSYVELRQHQQRLAIARASLAAQEETLQMVLWRTEAGLVGQLDSEQAHQNVETTRAIIPQLEQSLIQAHNRLAVLMGRQPGELHDYLLNTSVNSNSDRVNSDSDRVNSDSDRVNSNSDRVNSDS